jgi:LPXTG-site transpeptidase (sortase) family protein
MRVQVFKRVIELGLTVLLALAVTIPPVKVAGGPSIGCTGHTGIVTIISDNLSSTIGSLRWEIACASPGATITFASALAGQTITLTRGEIIIDKDLTIDGSILSTPVSISGNSSSRIFRIPEASVTLKSLKVINGKASDCPAAGVGACGGGIYNNGTLTLSDSTVSNNKAVASGLPSNGGGIYNVHSLDVSNSTFSGNMADNGGGIYYSVESGSPPPLVLTLSNSTFSGNTANQQGGAIYKENSDSHVVLSYTTIVGNRAEVTGGGVDSNNDGNGLYLNNVILSNNRPGNCWTGDNAETYDYNIFSDDSCHFGNTATDGTHDLNNTNPRIGPLANNYGSTQTFALLPGSPAIDPGTNGSTCPATDQRGVARPVGTSCDTGAFEFDPLPQVLVKDSSPSDGGAVTGGISTLKVVFNKDVLHDGSSKAANNVINYLLVGAGTNDVVDTRSCLGGRLPDDIKVVVNSVSYDFATFTATLAVNGGVSLPVGVYKLFICGTTSITDPFGLKLNYGLSDASLNFRVIQAAASAAVVVPATGFIPDQVTALPEQTVAYADLGDLWLEIPRLGVQMPIVGVPQSGGGWDVSWLGNNAGWLNGSAFPTHAGNAVLTGHVWNADNTPGPFAGLNQLWWGDKVIVHAWGGQYLYEVRSVEQVSPGNATAMLEHEDLPWVTLVTCRGYDAATGGYQYRVLVRAVLVDMK